MNRVYKTTAVIFAALFLNQGAFAQVETIPKHPDYAQIFLGEDKFEKRNRKIFNFNQKLNKYALRPVHILWTSLVPQYGIDRLQSAAENIEYPKRLVSSLIQKDFKNCGNETLRFLTNTTIGLGGMFDPAKSFFKLEPKRADMDKALCKCKVKQGNYHVVPVLNGVTTRSLTGKILEWPLDPCLYLGAPVTSIVKAGLAINRTTYLQPLAKMIEQTYADPYDIAKKLFGIENYIKNENLDDPKLLEVAMSLHGSSPTKDEVLAVAPAAKTETEQEIEPIGDTLKGQAHSDNLIIDDNFILGSNLLPDVILADYLPQSPIVDAMRTALFSAPNMYNSIWNELSIWNRCFVKRIKQNKVEFAQGRDKYAYRYILQKNDNAPLAILYPSVGEGVATGHNNVFAKIFYDEGYHVVMLGSHFHYQFAKSMPEEYFPGFPAKDSEYLQLLTKKVLDDIEERHNLKFGKKILLGTSFGALQTLFVASNEEKNKLLDINGYISINPPIELIYAIKMLDKNNLTWQNSPDDLKSKVALVATKVVQLLKLNKEGGLDLKTLPFCEEEGRLITAFLLQQKLSDLIFTLENGAKLKNKNELYSRIYSTNFSDYADKYLKPNSNLSEEEFEHAASLHYIADFLKNSENYKIYHTLDDYFVNLKQLEQLQNYAGDNLVLFNVGSHLGYLYRKEFLRALKGHTRAVIWGESLASRDKKILQSD